MTNDSKATRKKLLGLHRNVFVLRHPKHLRLPTRHTSLWWSHHEKIVVVDQTIAFVGGIDICSAPYDQPTYAVSDPPSPLLMKHSEAHHPKERIQRFQPLGMRSFFNDEEYGNNCVTDSFARKGNPRWRTIGGPAIRTVVHHPGPAIEDCGCYLHEDTSSISSHTVSKTTEVGPTKSQPTYLIEQNAVAKCDSATLAGVYSISSGGGKKDHGSMRPSQSEPPATCSRNRGSIETACHYPLPRNYGLLDQKPSIKKGAGARGSRIHYVSRDVEHPRNEDQVNRSMWPRLPWHDMAVVVGGAAAADAAFHFVQSWNHHRIMLGNCAIPPIMLRSDETTSSLSEVHVPPSHNSPYEPDGFYDRPTATEQNPFATNHHCGELGPPSFPTAGGVSDVIRCTTDVRPVISGLGCRPCYRHTAECAITSPLSTYPGITPTPKKDAYTNSFLHCHVLSREEDETKSEHCDSADYPGTDETEFYNKLHLPQRVSPREVGNQVHVFNRNPQRGELSPKPEAAPDARSGKRATAEKVPVESSHRLGDVTAMKELLHRECPHKFQQFLNYNTDQLRRQVYSGNEAALSRQKHGGVLQLEASSPLDQGEKAKGLPSGWGVHRGGVAGLDDCIGGGADCWIQILRSVGKWSLGVPRERSIAAGLEWGIRHAHHFVYIETQFFTAGHAHQTIKNEIGFAIMDRIRQAIYRFETFRCIFVLPCYPEGCVDTNHGIRASLHFQLKTICRGKASIYGRLGREFPDVDLNNYLTFYSLRSAGMVGNLPVTEQIYVHSKIMIVDDRVVFIGSANMNDRSLMGNRDSELMVMVGGGRPIETMMAGARWVASEFAYQLRIRLWGAHLGISPDVLYNLMKGRAPDAPAVGTRRQALAIPRSAIIAKMSGRTLQTYVATEKRNVDIRDPAAWHTYRQMWMETALQNTDWFEKYYPELKRFTGTPSRPRPCHPTLVEQQLPPQGTLIWFSEAFEEGKSLLSRRMKLLKLFLGPDAVL